MALQRQALRLHDCSLIGAALGALEVNTIAAMYAEVQHSNDLINLIHPQGFRRPVKIPIIAIPLGLAQIFPEISRDLTLNRQKVSIGTFNPRGLIYTHTCTAQPRALRGIADPRYRVP